MLFSFPFLSSTGIYSIQWVCILLVPRRLKGCLPLSNFRTMEFRIANFSMSSAQHLCLLPHRFHVRGRVFIYHGVP